MSKLRRTLRKAGRKWRSLVERDAYYYVDHSPSGRALRTLGSIIDRIDDSETAQLVRDCRYLVNNYPFFKVITTIGSAASLALFFSEMAGTPQGMDLYLRMKESSTADAAMLGTTRPSLTGLDQRIETGPTHGPWDQALYDFMNLPPEERYQIFVESSWANNLNIPTGEDALQGRIDSREFEMPYIITESQLKTFLEDIKSPLLTYRDPFTKSAENPEGELATSILTQVWEEEGLPIPIQLMKLQTEHSLVQQNGSNYEERMKYAVNYGICLPLRLQPKGLRAQLFAMARHFNDSMAYWNDPLETDIFAPQPPENFASALEFAFERFSPAEDNHHAGDNGIRAKEFEVYYRLKDMYLDNHQVVLD